MRSIFIIAVALTIIALVALTSAQILSPILYGGAGVNVIVPISGSTNNSGASNVTTITVTYTPSTGNQIVVILSTNGSITSPSCHDQNSNALTAGPTASNTNQGLLFYGTAITGATSYICSWSNTHPAAILVESYAGVGSVNASLSGNSNTGSTSTATTSSTTEVNNAWIVGGLCSNVSTLTGSVGNQRQQTTAGTRCVLMDNTSSTPASTTISATLSAVNWTAVAIELKP